jgi:hypothetical protein
MIAKNHMAFASASILTFEYYTNYSASYTNFEIALFTTFEN